MKSFIKNENKKIAYEKCQLRYRRINWTSEAKQIISSSFIEFKIMSIANDFPFKFSITNNGSENEEIIQLMTNPRKIGITRHPLKNIEQPTDNSSIEILIEKGSSLVASQTAWGTVCIIATPLKSEFLETKENEFILFYDIDPRNITKKLIEKALKQYLLILRSSSIETMNSLSLVDQINLLLIENTDVRKVANTIRNGISQMLNLIFSKFAALILAIIGSAYFGWLKF